MISWHTYAVHDLNNIKGFFGDYRYLSNFHECNVPYNGIDYRSSENAYQAAKVMPEFRINFKDVKPNSTKKLWKKYPLENSESWDVRKYDIMKDIVVAKFSHNKDLLEDLIKTGNRYLEETNSWGDKYWGVDYKAGGLNNLGKILMDVRTQLMSPIEKARLNKEKVKECLKDIDGIVGVGITSINKVYTIKVNVSKKELLENCIPSNLQGTPIVVEYIGPITAS